MAGPRKLGGAGPKEGWVATPGDAGSNSQSPPKPREAVEAAERRRPLSVARYGVSTRRVEAITGAGHWYKAGAGLVPIRWAFVHDRDGTHRYEYFYSTDPGLGVRAIIATYTGRWDTETTFHEARSELHLETTRGWPRATPRMFGMCTVAAILYVELPRGRRVGDVPWPGKSAVSSSGTPAADRRRIWADGVFSHLPGRASVAKLRTLIREILYAALAPAA